MLSLIFFQEVINCLGSRLLFLGEHQTLTQSRQMCLVRRKIPNRMGKIKITVSCPKLEERVSYVIANNAASIWTL